MSTSVLKWVNTLSLIFMLVMNYLAVNLPLGGVTTGELSDLYPNLFVPAGFTFSIWGVIFLLLILHVGWQWTTSAKTIVQKLGPWFAINTIANATWIAVWHAKMVEASLLVMLVILVSLIKIYQNLSIHYPKVNVWYKIPFSIYLGWISVATIANVTTLLVHHGVTSIGFSQHVWATIMIIIATVLAGLMLYKRKDIFYTLVIMWACYGIYAKRVSEVLPGDKLIANTATGCSVVLALLSIYTLYTFKGKPSGTD